MIMSIKWREERYLGYLTDSRYSLNPDFFIYKEENSINNTRYSISNLEEIFRRIIVS